MKHNAKIIIILITMFIITQFIGLYVVNSYLDVKIVEGEKINKTSIELPYGLDVPEIEDERTFYEMFISILFAFVIAMTLLFILIKYKSEIILRLWFFAVVAIALGISINSFLPRYSFMSLLVLLISVPLAYLKIFKKNLLVHNLTELLIYPGIAAIFVPILNIYTVIGLLILVSIYDMWAVWKSGIMQKMAKYQINKLNIFSGFFVPYAGKKMKLKIKKMKKTLSKEELKKKKIKVNVAILGGGDVIFPIIVAGVFLKTLGIYYSLFVILGSVIGLSTLFLLSEKKKFYPAMPFISLGIFFGLFLAYIINVFTM